MPPKHDSQYDVVRPEGCPDWFVLGILCEVWNGDLKPSKTRLARLYGYQASAKHPFLSFDEDGDIENYRFASPVERWKPKVGEWVAGTNREDILLVAPFRRMNQDGIGIIMLPSGLEIICYTLFRLDYPDGRVIDLRGSTDDIKKRTDWV